MGHTLKKFKKNLSENSRNLKSHKIPKIKLAEKMVLF